MTQRTIPTQSVSAIAHVGRVTVRVNYAAESGGYLHVIAGDQVDLLVGDETPGESYNLYSAYAYGEVLATGERGWFPLDICHAGPAS